MYSLSREAGISIIINVASFKVIPDHMADEKTNRKTNLGIASSSARFAEYNFECLALPLSSVCQGRLVEVRV